MYVGRSVLYTYIINELGLNYTQIGVAAGAASTVSGFLQIFFSLAGRFVPRRLLIALGNILMSLASFGIGLSNRFLGFVSSQIVGGVGSATQHSVSVSIISERFDNKEVSTPIGIFYGLGYLGNILSPIILTAIALTFGWRSALFALAIFPLTTSLLLIVYLRKDRYSGRSKATEHSLGLWDDVRSALRIKGAMAIIAAQALLAGGTGQGVITTYMPLFLRNGLHLDQLQASFIYSLAMLGGVVGTILFGRYANKLGYLKTIMVCTGVASISVFFLSLQGAFNFALIPHLIIVGFITFPISSLMQSGLSAFSDPEQRDILLGLYFALGFSASSLWSTLIGLLIDKYGVFTSAWYLMSGLSVLALSLQTLAYKQRKAVAM
jgi:predicted MFS family arabinose efflux permease